MHFFINVNHSIEITAIQNSKVQKNLPDYFFRFTGFPPVKVPEKSPFIQLSWP